jgi:hypothetical protein
MASRIIATRNRDALVCGLQWHPLVERKRTKEILAYAANNDADKVLVVQKDGIATVGLSSRLDDEDVFASGDTTVKPKRLYSAAAVAAFHLGNVNAVIALTMPDNARAVVIVISSGVPALDEIKGIEAAQELVGGYLSGKHDGAQYPLLTNDLGSFPQAESSFDVYAVWESSGKAAEIVNKPVNYAALFATAVILVAAAASVNAWRAHVKKAKLAAAAAAAAAADPLPQYDAMLMSQIGRLGWNAAALVKVLDQVERQPLFVDGWALHSVVCKAESNECVSEWTREAGLSGQLIAARAPFAEKPTADSTKNRLLLSYRPEGAVSGPTSPAELPTIKDWSASSTNLMQLWENAGIQMSVAGGGFTLWPAMPNIANSAIPVGVGVRAVATTFIAPIDVTREAVLTEPSNYYWRELTVSVGQTVADPLKLDMKGMIYAR